LVQILEMRLDAFVLRAGLAPMIDAARQYVLVQPDRQAEL
jgi:ribosomal protein S4